MAYIYKITNDINDKVYIGKTTYSIEKRFQEHCSDAYSKLLNRPLYSAMRKYGTSHFRIEQICECTEEVLNEKEIYYIQQYNSYHNGYNATYGGEGKTLYDHQAIIQRVKELNNCAAVAKEFNCCVDTVYNIIKTENIHTTYNTWECTAQPVLQFDLNHNYIQSFDSYADAARWLYNNNKCKSLCSGVRSHISECAKGKRFTAYGYIWQDTNINK